jgi:hypothetical protein
MSNGLYRVFTTAKRALSFQQEGVLSANTFFTFKKVRGAHAPIASPVPQLLVLMNKAII